jgi:hypothetical protein
MPVTSAGSPEVALERDARPPARTDGGDGIVRRRVVASIVERDVEPVAREPLDDRAADPARAAGDEGERHEAL